MVTEFNQTVVREGSVDKIWLKNYEPGVPASIDPDEYPSVVAIAKDCFQRFSTQPCFSNFGHILTYQQIDELSNAFAGFLQTAYQLSPGDRIAIMLPNVMQYPVAMYGALKAGLIVVNVNPLYTARELKFVLKDSGAKCIVILEHFAHTLEKILADTEIQHVIVTEIGDLLGRIKGSVINFMIRYVKQMIPQWHIPQAIQFKKSILSKYQKAFKEVEITPEHIAFLQYTGGTTGGPKGAMLTHRNMVAAILQVCAWIGPFFQQKMEGGIITALPLYHIYSLTGNCLVFLKLGIPNILITNPRDIPQFVKELKRQPFCAITGVNTLFNALLHNMDFCRLDFSKLKLAMGGGMAMQELVANQWQRVTGIPLLEAYGLTEASPGVTINPFNLKAFNGKVGLPFPSTEIKICDENDEELPIGQAGELCVRGPQVMLGYWRQPEKTKEILSSDGWLKTGDIAKIDEEGFIELVDRKKDIIIVSGFNVYPNEVEEVIASIKGVKEVAVIGIKSLEHGEVVKAFIVRSDPTLTFEKIINYCHQEMTAYKVPKEIEFRRELPKTNVGKVLRRALREETQ